MVSKTIDDKFREDDFDNDNDIKREYYYTAPLRVAMPNFWQFSKALVALYASKQLFTFPTYDKYTMVKKLRNFTKDLQLPAVIDSNFKVCIKKRQICVCCVKFYPSIICKCDHALDTLDKYTFACDFMNVYPALSADTQPIINTVNK